MLKAVENNDLEKANYLVKQGAKMDSSTLWYVVECIPTLTDKYPVEQGADINIRDDEVIPYLGR